MGHDDGWRRDEGDGGDRDRFVRRYFSRCSQSGVV